MSDQESRLKILGFVPVNLMTSCGGSARVQYWWVPPWWGHFERRLSFYFVSPLWIIVFVLNSFNVSDQILFAEWREAVQTCGNARKGEFETMVDETTLVS